MKIRFTLFLILSISISSIGQEFLWAESYDISNCNEVAALSADENGNIFTSGVYNASVYLPYQGNAYIQKTDDTGQVLWTDYLSGTLIIGDMATVDDQVLIIGQSNGAFTYRDEQYGDGDYFMFALMLDGDGDYLWHFTDVSKYGANSTISTGNTENIALHIRGQYNLGDWIIIIDDQGYTIHSKLLSATETLVVDMAFYDDKVYLNGGYMGNGSIAIDTILIETPSVEHVSFVLALDENLVAQWVLTDTTFNNRDGRIVANENGVFSYQSALRTPFNFITLIKKLNQDGQLLLEVEPPIFSNAVTLYPDMVITPTMLGLFAQNAFDFDSHKVILFDHDLNILSEKVIDGSSNLYSGQIANQDDNIFVSHVYSGNLNFDNDLTLPYSGTGKRPYIAKIGGSEVTAIYNGDDEKGGLMAYPNPANEVITMDVAGLENGAGVFSISDMKGTLIQRGIFTSHPSQIDISQIPTGFYFLHAQFENGESHQQKIIVQ